MAVEHTLENAHAWKRRRYFQCVVVTETIDHDDVARPGETLECASNVRCFVVSENEWRDLIEHYGRDRMS